MSVILRKRKNKDGTTSLRLDIFYNGERKIETLKQLQLSKPTTVLDREQNKKRLLQAEQIAVTRAAQLQANDYNMGTDAGRKTIVIEWMQHYVDNYKKKDVRNISGALKKFKLFLIEEKKSDLAFGNLTPILIEDFIEYLETISTGEGALSYYNRFKKMVKQAYRKNILSVNPIDKVQKKVKGNAKKKDILTLAEIKRLADTPTESSEVRRAALFSCVTGLRWKDIKELKWNSIRIDSKEMNVDQSKTDKPVFIPLNDTAIKLLQEPGKKNDFVFNLPSANGANKTVKAWVKRAGIDKKITWHNFRHSFGTNLIFNDVDVLTASKLLGHTTMKHTQRYVDVAKEMKEAATDKLNFDL